MNEDEIRQQVNDTLKAASAAEPPAFDDVWASAERRHERSRQRYRVFSGVAAAAAVAVVAVSVMRVEEAAAPDEFLIADALLNSTSWSAPSDTLMPEHQFDIYQDIPSLIESTYVQEGSLL